MINLILAENHSKLELKMSSQGEKEGIFNLRNQTTIILFRNDEWRPKPPYPLMYNFKFNIRDHN